MKKAKIYYFTLTDEMRKEEKLNWFRSHSIEQLEFEYINPDKNSNWINLADTDFESLLPLANKETKLGKGVNAVFKLFSLGVVTNRDEWVYDNDKVELEKKVKFLIEVYNQDLEKLKGKTKIEIKDKIDYSIKWTRSVINDLSKGKKYYFNKELIIDTLYRPFSKKKLYFSKELNEMQYLMQKIWGENGSGKNFALYISGSPASKPFQCITLKIMAGLDFFEKTQCLPLYRYDKSGNRVDNITDWGLEQFRNHYHLSEPGFSGLKDKQDLTDGKKRKKSGKSVKRKNAEGEISKEDIFHYVYAVLHNPAYREKYELNLKREFPRIPFYDDFWKWANWGKALMDLHINYETAKPFDLKEHHAETKADSPRSHAKRGNEKTAKEPEAVYAPKIKPRLKADREKGIIEIDEITFLSSVPKEAWEYRLGNRSALEWILDQYKEKKPKDPTIAEKFNTYRFADYKEHVIDLLKRVCTVSVETMKIVEEMKKVRRVGEALA